MKKTALCILLSAFAAIVAMAVTPPKAEVRKLYVFGFAASFNDTIVHFTDIQELDSAWTDTKTHFLELRQQYSYQLRNFLWGQQLPNRTCVVFYDADRKKLEKRYQKMRRLYTTGRDGKAHYDVRQAEGFSFTAIDYRPYMADADPQPAVTAPQPAAPANPPTPPTTRHPDAP
ncbi:MAG: hypothetical protein IJT98_08500 [Prevotella sp.]|nr:hypothetical protein [Prevotella sp.]